MEFNCDCGAVSYETPPECHECGRPMKHGNARLSVLEREHQQFFERWHGERRKREKLAHDVERCYRMLLSEPDTKGALFKAENILREALAEAKTETPNADVTGLAPAQEGKS